MFGEDEGDTANSLFYYDGKTVTVYDRGQKTYATEKVPGTIDAMLDDLHDRFDTDQTLADFLFADPYKVFTEHVQSGTYVGLHHVGKVKCHHLAFRQKLLDWQIWIDAARYTEEGGRIDRAWNQPSRQECVRSLGFALTHRLTVTCCLVALHGRSVGAVIAFFPRRKPSCSPACSHGSVKRKCTR